MNRTRLLALATTLLLLLCLAGMVAAERPKLGFKVGTALAERDPDWDRSSQLGLTFSLCSRASITSVLSVRLEAQFVQKGCHTDIYRWDIDFNNGPTEYHDDHRERVDYLSVPILFELSLPGRQHSSTPYVFVGPHVDIRLSKFALDRPRMVRDYKGTVLGGTAGLGMRLSLGNGRVLIGEFGYQWDVSDAVESVWSYYPGEEHRSTQKNRAFVFTLGYEF